MTEPSFSVVLPVRNGAATIAAQLEALASQQPSRPWELVVVDNGSTDDTRAVVEAWRDRLPLRLIEAADPGISFARNAGVAAARCDRLLFCDSDDVVQPGWCDAMVEALATADLVGGCVRDNLLDEESEASGLRWLEPYPTDRLPKASGGGSFAPGANFAVMRPVVEALGGWDPAMLTAEDIDFSWRARAAGFRLAFAPGAVVAYRQRSGARDIARQSFSYGRSRRRLQTRHRQVAPNRRGAALGVVRTGLVLSAALLLRPWSRRGRLRWLRWVAYALGWLLPGRMPSPSATRPVGSPLPSPDA